MAAGPHHVAHHLHGHRRLAETLRTAEEDELARPEAAGEGLVEDAETGRQDGRAGCATLPDRVVGALEEVGDRRQASVVGG